MVELRKRKEAPTAPPALTKRNSSTARSKAAKPADPHPVAENPAIAAAEHAPLPTNGATSGKVEVGSVLDLEGIGGEVELNDGTKTRLKALVEGSGSGVVVFTYPKASTPGCTTQACLFRDSYLPITGASLAIYGLSTDSPKSNTTFVTKQNLQYPLICDPSGALIKALGLGKAGNKTARGVVVIDKQAHVRVHTAGGPQATLDAVLNYVKDEGMEMGAPSAVGAPPADDPHATEEAAKLADPGLADPDKQMDEVPLERDASKEEMEVAETAAEVSETAKKLDG